MNHNLESQEKFLLKVLHNNVYELRRHAEEAKQECQRTPAHRGSDTGVGRLGFGPDAAPLPSNTTDRQGGEARDPGQNEKGGPVCHECPSVVWHGLGPAPASQTSPHPSIDIKDREIFVIYGGNEDKKDDQRKKRTSGKASKER